ncbi:PREDICTED: protein RTF2 homolog [Camelina sativa]|uniref:Protein RTF2 homolog n=1 Tax=Camelina sativa TaxID=90675 RepID=A0ABM0Y4W6_CAMSA|nr:PREDICTED: protein RTF2 homolog [Camelina sativa]
MKASNVRALNESASSSVRASSSMIASSSMRASNASALSESVEREDVAFQCPVSGLEFNGESTSFSLWGHVMSSKALMEVKSTSSCLVCHADVKESDKIVINGTEEEVSSLREKLEKEKAKLREMKGVSNKSGTAVVADTGAKVAKMADTGEQRLQRDRWLMGMSMAIMVLL